MEQRVGPGSVVCEPAGGEKHRPGRVVTDAPVLAIGPPHSSHRARAWVRGDLVHRGILAPGQLTGLGVNLALLLQREHQGGARHPRGWPVRPRV